MSIRPMVNRAPAGFLNRAPRAVQNVLRLRTAGRLRAALLGALLAVSLVGCADRYFRDAGDPDRPPPRYGLSGLPVSEYWTGIVFNGRKIGFSHFVVTPVAGEEDRFEIRSEAVLHVKFLMMEKNVTLRSRDLVDGDLRLHRFEYDYIMDGNRLRLTGSLEGDILKVVRASDGVSSVEELNAEGILYPASGIYLYPLLKGLEVGRRYEYRIYDGETQSIETVQQEIQAYQSSDFFAGEAYRMRTSFHGQEVSTWLDGRGLPVLERALGGVLVSGLEPEQEARKYLVESTLNRDESLLEFSLIRISPPLEDPDRIVYLEIFFDGVPRDITIPTDARQECEWSGGRLLCRIRAESSGGPLEPVSGEHSRYLRPSPTVVINDEIRAIADTFARGTSTQIEQVRRIVAWMRDNISREPVDAFTALDVLSRRKAECQGHALLYTAFARSLGIPTRVANGIVYAESLQGFLYHSWTESFVDGRWIAVDPTSGQLPADATHIKLLEGESLSSLVPLVSMIGRVGIEVVEAR